MEEVFKGNFTQQEPLSEEAIAAAVDVMRHGRLHRYNEAAGETSQTALLEQEFADMFGAKYALAVASGGYALATALRAVGVKPGQRVLTNAFTLAPVPGAIASVGAVPEFIEVTEDLVIDLEDLDRKATRGDVLLLSHMRGHIVDMDALMALANARAITVIEDCAHTMGAKWNGTWSGRFGHVGCYSTQTYKHINSGEGGFVVCDDPKVMAKAVLLSGSYMFFDRHPAGPPPEAYEGLVLKTPNISGRMDNLRAAILRPQLRDLAKQCAAWNARYYVLDDILRGAVGITCINLPEKEGFVASSYQFLLLDWAAKDIQAFVDGCLARGVVMKWFGADVPAGYTSRYQSWAYAPTFDLPKTDRILHSIMDLRLPLTFTLEDCAQIGRIISNEIAKIEEKNRKTNKRI
ncbi:MAG: DegT/DnrJ/EryC1/StrS family aminotransferase [Planktomarina sp.]